MSGKSYLNMWCELEQLEWVTNLELTSILKFEEFFNNKKGDETLHFLSKYKLLHLGDEIKKKKI